MNTVYDNNLVGLSMRRRAETKQTTANRKPDENTFNSMNHFPFTLVSVAVAETLRKTRRMAINLFAIRQYSAAQWIHQWISIRRHSLPLQLSTSSLTHQHRPYLKKAAYKIFLLLLRTSPCHRRWYDSFRRADQRMHARTNTFESLLVPL